MVVLANQVLISSVLNARIIGPSSKTVVLAHGFGTDQSAWDKVLPLLSIHHRVVLFDWGFSGSVKDEITLFDPIKYSSYDAFADDLIVLLEELDVKSATLAGHSMSAMIGCIASIKRPQLFKKLVLVSASPRYINSEDYEFGFKRSDVDQLISTIETNFQTWASNFPPLVIDQNDPLSIQNFEKSLKRMSPEVALSTAKLVFYGDYTHILDNVTTPCLIVQTLNDIVVPMSVVDYMQKKIKAKSTVEMIHTNGHFPHLTAHVQFVEVIERALVTS
ncbi:strigolactone esterase D14-like [Impatiens glandulifera]|uniref:strigolactone esterase D14-like n=1 Tax=Impatiens glandulifera TaxID=253017 RepID=UPI001FB0E489|nr:strigolactone esterase D14-like [Impatiens glandulifera]